MQPATNSQALRDRTKSFALLVIRNCHTVPRTEESRIICRQLLRSATSVAANYRAVCRSRSKAEFVARLGIVVEEIHETELWLELLGESEILPPERLKDLLKEANELLAIFVPSQLTAKGVTPNSSIRKSGNSSMDARHSL